MLKEENINILSLSMADTTEYGMLRMIVSDPEKAKAGLRSKGFSAMLTDVLAVKLEDKVGEMHKMTHILCSQGLNISIPAFPKSVSCYQLHALSFPCCVQCSLVPPASP